MRRRAALIAALLVASASARAGEPERHEPVLYDEGLVIQTPDGLHRLKIGAQLQARFAFDHIAEADGSLRNEFALSIPRARLILSGHAFSPALRYAIEAAVDDGVPSLKDFFVDWGALPGDFHVRVGQMKQPFSRQRITPSRVQHFADRAPTDAAFVAGRDIGLLFHNGLERSPSFEWAVGLFNGTGTVAWTHEDGGITNVPEKFEPAVGARLGFNHGDLQGYAESDFAKGPFRWGIAISAFMSFDSAGENDSLLVGTADFIVKYRGFSGLGAFFVSSEQAGNRRIDQRTMGAAGYHLQVAYLVGELAEPVARFSHVIYEGARALMDDLMEPALGLNIFFWQHRLKWTTDVAARIRELNDGRDKTDWHVRTQLQLWL